MPLVVTDKEAGKHYSHGSGSNPSSSRYKNPRRSRTLNEEWPPTSEHPKAPPRHASQSLEDLVRCAICLEQLRRPTMVSILIWIWTVMKIKCIVFMWISSCRVNIRSAWPAYGFTLRRNWLPSVARLVGARWLSLPRASAPFQPIFF